MRLLLIRHGQTGSNVRGLLDSRTPGPELTELGRVQAHAVPRTIPAGEWSHVLASTMVRTQQTAAPLAEALGIRIGVDARLREIEAGELEMRGDSAAVRAYLHAVWSWAADDLSVPMPGAQGGAEFFERFDAAVDDAVALGGNPVVFSHGASIRVWAGRRCEGLSPDFAATHELHNTGFVLVERDARGRWTLVDWHTDPVGGAAFDGAGGGDPTGQG